MPPAATPTPATDWPAILAAQARDATTRLPFFILDKAQPLLTGSVARAHLPTLARWPHALRITDQAITLALPAAARTAFFAQANQALHSQGLIRAWRNETFPVVAQANGALLATQERAACRFWGCTTYSAHCNGYVADANGRPSHLWIARRAPDKPTDPGLLDNLIGGGVPHGQTPAQAVQREGGEEAGLQPAQLHGLAAGRRLRVARDIPEGLQLEEVSVYDLALPAGLTPHNQDGEVHSFTLMPLAQALAHAAAGDMTVDAALATLDFALRHRVLATPQHQHLQALSEVLWIGRASLAG